MNMASLAEIKKNPKIPELAPGDTVRVSSKIVEGDKERIQVFQGVIIKVRRGGVGASFTVRHVAYGIGVERTFPLYSPLVEKVEVVRHGKVRRAKLYYLRGLSGKEARRKIKRVEKKAEEIGEEVLGQPPEEIEEPEAVAGQEQAPAEVAAEKAPEPEQKPAAAQEAKLEAKPEEKPAAAPEAKLEAKPAKPEPPQDKKPEKESA